MTKFVGRVLIVEDHENWRFALRVLLESEGLQVSAVESSGKAKLELQDKKFNVAVLDIRLIDDDMLNIDGLELLQYIRKNYPYMRIVVLTGYPENLKIEPDADAIILKAPEGLTFDSVNFKKQIMKLVSEV